VKAMLGDSVRNFVRTIKVQLRRKYNCEFSALSDDWVVYFCCRNCQLD